MSLKARLDPDKIKVTDTFIKTLLKTLQQDIYKIDMSLSDELDTLLSVANENSKRAKRIPYGKNGPEDLIQVGVLLSKTQAFKDRVREIDISFMQVIQALTRLRGNADRYLKRTYGKEIFELKPVARQQLFVDSVLEEIINKLDDAIFIREKAEIVLANLVDTYFTLRETRAIAEKFFPEMGRLGGGTRSV